jgi:hypothetical protein
MLRVRLANGGRVVGQDRLLERCLGKDPDSRGTQLQRDRPAGSSPRG